MIRTFRVAEGRVVVLPRDVQAGPGDSNLHLQGGDTFTLPEERVTRFVRRRVEVGDLLESNRPPRTLRPHSALDQAGPDVFPDPPPQ